MRFKNNQQNYLVQLLIRQLLNKKLKQQMLLNIQIGKHLLIKLQMLKRKNMYLEQVFMVKYKLKPIKVN
jgi:hypothetical protein